jgi:predicted transcriptional regulator
MANKKAKRTAEAAARKEVSGRRIAWLDLNGLTIRSFAEVTNNDFGTAYKWIEKGRTPRRKYLDGILQCFPDFPLLRTK